MAESLRHDVANIVYLFSDYEYCTDKMPVSLFVVDGFAMLMMMMMMKLSILACTEKLETYTVSGKK